MRATRPQFLTAALMVLFAVWGGLGVLQTSMTLPPPVPRAVAMRPHRRPPVWPPAVQGAATAARPDCATTPCIALTFDDGPHPVVTPQILATLERHNVRATFFVIGVHVPGNEGLLQRMYADGDEIGNHTWGHADLTTLSADQVEEQVLNTQAVITAAGVPAPRLLRPPYGAVNTMVRSHVPLTIAMWNADPEDWKKTRASQVVASVETAAGPGKVIDMHDTKQPTADALDQILTDLAPSYQFVTVSELLNLAPGQPGVFFGR